MISTSPGAGRRARVDTKFIEIGCCSAAARPGVRALIDDRFSAGDLPRAIISAGGRTYRIRTLGDPDTARRAVGGDGSYLGTGLARPPIGG
jgi:hypothetical protein